MSTHCLSTFTQAAAQLRGRCELEAGARLPVAGSDKTSQNQSITPPILNQINRRNQQSVGLSEPNIRLKIHTGIPYAAGTAAQNACAAANLRRKFFFHRTNQPPSLRASEPPSRSEEHTSELQSHSDLV